MVIVPRVLIDTQNNGLKTGYVVGSIFRSNATLPIGKGTKALPAIVVMRTW